MSTGQSGVSKPVPESVGPYRIESRIGVGGMGAVYRAFDTRLKRPVAIKNILASVAQEPKIRRRFRREARAVASLNHPSIVQIYDLVESEEGDWIVMELIEGESLKQRIRDGEVGLRQAVRIGRKVAEGLAAAHDRGIVHRDLKVENVMITPDGQVKILDFGLAKELEKNADETEISVQGAVLGTSRTMSPEQAKGLEIDHRSDLFSLGILLYETLTGRSPFRASNPVATMTRICKHRQTPVQVLNPQVSEGLSDLIDHLLAKQPDDRIGSAREAAARLAQIGSGIADAGEGSGSESGSPPARQGMLLAGVTPAASSSPVGSRTGFQLKTLLRVELVGSQRLVERRGPSEAFTLLGRHDRLVRDLVIRHEGREIEKSESFLMLFDRPASAVRFALAYQEKIAKLAESEQETLAARVGIHLGKVFLRENSPEDVRRGAQLLEAEGRAKRVAALIMELACPEQILLTSEAGELARRSLGKQGDLEGLCWASHGVVSLAEVDAEVRLFEVGIEGRAPLRPPVQGGAEEEAGAPAVSGFPPGRRVAPPASGRRWLAAAAGVAILIVAWLAVSRADLLSAPPPATPPGPPSLAILGFENRTGSADADWMAVALTDLLATELTEGERLRPIPGESVARTKVDLGIEAVDELTPDDVRGIARRLQADYVLVASYHRSRDGDRSRLEIRPQVRGPAGEVVLRLERTAEEDRLVELVEDLSSELESRLVGR